MATVPQSGYEVKFHYVNSANDINEINNNTIYFLQEEKEIRVGDVTIASVTQ